jgi:hypothetical protein
MADGDTQFSPEGHLARVSAFMLDCGAFVKAIELHRPRANDASISPRF